MTSNSNSTGSQTDLALEKLLDMATPVPPSPDLKAKIMASAINGGGEVKESTGAEIISFAQARSVKQTEVDKPRFRLGGNWAAGGLIAASLVIGIWTGTAGYADNLISAPLELAGLQAPASSEDLSIYGLIEDFSKDGNLL